MIRRIIAILINVGSVVGIFYLGWKGGVKGILGFSFGMFIMAYMLLSNNPIMRFVLDFARARHDDTNLDDFQKKEKLE